MTFKNEDYKVSLDIVGYEFKKRYDKYDDNWLYVTATYENLKDKKVTILKDASILTWELEELKKWLKSIKDNNIEKSKISFLEPELEFRKFKNYLILELCFDLSIKTKRCIKFTHLIDESFIENLIKNVEEWIRSYPQR